jgi:LacI family repressor for deo operon, udp, cdd, tsx, nupC, and nupG
MARVGIKDIAARAGVSIATVSHAFRNPGRVSDKTREKVLKAAKEVGYTPNVHAVSLRTAKAGSIVVIMPDVADSYNANIIKGIESVARDRGYSVLLGDSGGSEEREKEFAAMVQSRQADGIILMSHRMPFDLPDDIAPEDLPPLVNGSEYTGHDEFPCVSIDDRQGAIDATNHLLQLGHTNIAIITGERDSTSARNRLDGYRQAMADAGVTVDESLVIFGEYTADSGEYGTRELMIRKRRPTAIFCFSDEIALGSIYALQDAGFSVPHDVSVIGFDDIPFSRYFVPSLTTVAQPTEAIGRTCATLLCDLIDGKRPKNNRFILPHTLIVRDSTAPLASAT